ncbi:MAG: hypothetical protein L6R42_010911, partial [Xanthoria sp. 1 TBL-2021]
SAAQSSSAPNGTSNLNTASSYAIVQAAIQRAQERLLNDAFVPWKFHPRHSDFEPAANATKVFIKNVTIQQTLASYALSTPSPNSSTSTPPIPPSTAPMRPSPSSMRPSSPIAG